MLLALISYTDDIFFAIIQQSIYLVYCCISFRWVTLNFSRVPIYKGRFYLLSLRRNNMGAS